MSRTSLLSSGVSALALSACLGGLSAPATAASFNITSGTTTTSQTLGNGETGDVASGAALSVTANGGSGNAVTVNGTSVVITNAGTIQNLGTGRAIQAPSGGATTRDITLNNSGRITSADDAFRINTDVTSGNITVNNSGTMKSTGGQVIDFAAIATGGVTISINNLASGVIESVGEDAVRPGKNATVTNWGQIISSTGGDGVDVQTNGGTVINKTGGTISAGKHGVNVGTNGTVTVINEAGATITGRNGSGVGSDGYGTVTNYGTIIGAYDGSGTGDGDGVDIDFAATITNYGTIKGTGAAGYDSGGRLNNSEGLSIGGGTVLNYGLISGKTYGIVVNNDSNADGSRGGTAATTLTNHGTIIGETGFAVRFENKSTATPSINDDTIINTGTIIGNGVIPDPSAIITLQGGGVDTRSVGTLDGVNYTGTGSARFIRGDGSAIQTGEGNDVLKNYGTITGNTGRAINMEGGDDLLENGGTINGDVSLGVGSNTLNNLAGGVLNVNTVLSVGAGNTVSNAGVISPGGSGTIETTALTGNLVQTSTGSLAIDLDAASNIADRVDVSGSAALGGSISLSVAGIAINSGTVTVLTAGSGATHSGLSLIASPALQAFLLYPDANTVQVAYDISFAPTSAGLNTNQAALGGYLNAATASDPTRLTEVTGALLSVTSNGAYAAALDQLSPEIYGDGATSSLYGAHAFGNALLSCRARDAQWAAVSEDQCLWIALGGRTLDQDATRQNAGYNEQSWGVSAGGQVNVAPSYVLGIAGGFENGNADTSNGAKADIARAYAGVSLKHTMGQWYAAGAVFGGTGSTDATRPVGFGGLQSSLVGDQTVSHLSGRLRVAYQAGGNALYLKPMVDLEATQLWLGSVEEQGGPGALVIASSTETLFSAAPAIEIGGEAKLGDGTLVRPFARVGGVFYSEDSFALSSAFAGAPANAGSFATIVQVDDAMGNVGAGLDLLFKDGTTIKAQYDGLFGADTQQHSFGAKASVKF